MLVLVPGHEGSPHVRRLMRMHIGRTGARGKIAFLNKPLPCPERYSVSGCFL